MTDVVLAAVIERLDAFARLRMAEEGTPGLVLALTDRDGPLHAAAYGFANVESGEAMTIGHLLETGSIGKSFTAIAILQLHEEGRIDLHAPIREYLPWFEVRTTFQSTMEQTFCAAVERLTGRRVHSFMSQVDPVNGLGVEVFVLEPLDDGQGAA